MTSSNKARRYLQHHKQHYTDTHNSHQSAAELLIIDPTLAVTTMRKFRGRIQQQQQQPSTTTATVSIPQICVDNDDDDDINKSNNDDENGHVAILNEFDEVLENELKRTSVLRTSSLKHKESTEQINIPVNQQRSFSFALGSTTNLQGKHTDNDDESENDNPHFDEPGNISSSSSSKSTKIPSTIKASLSKETFSRLLHSLAFRSNHHTTSKTITTTTTGSSRQQPCLACQNHSNLELIPKYKKRPSIFGVLVSKLNTNTNTTTTISNEINPNRCPVCKRRLSKSTFYNSLSTNSNDDNQQQQQQQQNISLTSSLTSSKLHNSTHNNTHGQILLHTKRRRSLPSLFHSLFDFDHHDKNRLDNHHSTQIQHRPSFSSILTHTLLDSINREHQQPQQSISVTNIKQTSPLSYSSVSLAESDDSEETHIDKSFQRQSTTYDDSFQLTEKLQVRIDSDGINPIKDEYDNENLHDKETSLNELTDMNNPDLSNESNPNQLFLHPPDGEMSTEFEELMSDSTTFIVNHRQKLSTNTKIRREKTRSLLVNVFRTRRSNAALGSNETNMVGKQFSVSVINLATSINSNRVQNNNNNNETGILNLLDQRKHALSEESLPTTDGSYIYFTNINGQNFKERLKYSNTSENTTLREILLKLFEKHHLTIETCNICLRSAPTLPLSLDQPVKHVLLDDLIVTEKEHGLPTCSRLNHRPLAKASAGKERNEKRNSTSSTVFTSTSKSTSSTSKRLSSQCMVLDNDDLISPVHSNSNHNQEVKSTNSQQHTRSGKTSRSGLFTSSIFTREANDERPESNLAFVRRKCDEWLTHGLPKTAQLPNNQIQIDERDLKIEKEWQPFLNEQARSLMPESIKLQQEAIYEMLSTEVSYIRQILTMTEMFMKTIMILKSSQRDGLLNDIDIEKLFSNIQDVLNANLSFWKDVLLPIKIKLEQTGCAMNPSDFKNGFLKFDVYFKSYIHYVLDQKASAEYFKQKLAKDDLFQYIINWIETNFTNRLSFSDLTIKPLQRLTQYKLLLEAIQKRTQDKQQRNDLYEMIQKVANFVNRVNSLLHDQEQEERVRQISERIGPFENILAPPEITSMLQEYNRDSFSHRLDLLRDMPLYVRGYRRQIVHQGPMKMKDAKNSQDVYCYLFTDMFLITKGGKRSGTNNSSSSTSTSLTSISNDGQFNRTTPTTVNKILKPPIRIDRLDVREYDRRGGGSSNSNNEPNTASFVALVISEYNLIECGYLFQTNLSRQWIEKIRATKAEFQLLLEESKMKLQNAHNYSVNNSNLSTAPTQPPPPPPPQTATSSSSSNSTSSTIHQSLPSLNSTSETSLDLPVIKHDGTSLDSSSTDEHMINLSTESIPRTSKTESDVYRIVEQTRRNSRTDHKNYGRYFTDDGTGTHCTNPSLSSSSSINPSSVKSSPSTTIVKRMSWNETNNNTNSTTNIPNNELSNTNSFRSVHSSSGVSSTGSFLFSTDEESSIMTGTTSSSIPVLSSLSSSSTTTTVIKRTKTDDLTDELDEFDGKSSSSTVIGADDHEQLSNLKSINDINSNHLINSDMCENLSNRLSTASTSTLTSSSNNQPLTESISTVDNHISSPETSLRRTPYPSVKKRSQIQPPQRSGFQQQAFRRHRIFDENDLRSSTHTIVYDSSKPANTTTTLTINPIRRALLSSDDNNMLLTSFGGNGNESDYDNHQCNQDYSNISKYFSSSTPTTRFIKLPVNDLNQSNQLTHTDDLLLGDQNEIVLNNSSTLNDNNNHSIDDDGNNDDDNDNNEARVDLSDDNDDIDGDENTIQSTINNNNNQQSDNNNIISSINSLQTSSNQRINNNRTSIDSTSTIDDNLQPNYVTYRRDPLAARRLLDIRSHLLLNTTLDATEV